ncbi:MAG: hypothetical protein E7583_10355 [Ruminococcaceae bacterium]|nr:hypothetical protein [Oscillospiraceae bacterium]
MRCKKDTVLRGMIAGIAAGTACAFAVGYGVTKICSCKRSTLKKKAGKALRDAKKCIEGLM